MKAIPTFSDRRREALERFRKTYLRRLKGVDKETIDLMWFHAWNAAYRDMAKKRKKP